MSRLVIVGAGGFGREISWAVGNSPRFREKNDIEDVVFVDDVLKGTVAGFPVVGGIRGFWPEVDDLGICAIGSSASRRAVAEELEARELRFVPFVDDHASVGPSVSLHDGVIVCHGSVITADVTLGRHVHVNCNCMIGHDVEISDFATLSSSVNLTGGVTVGADAFVATGATVIPARKIGCGATVGAGSVVVRHVKPRTTVFGNPAKAI